MTPSDAQQKAAEIAPCDCFSETERTDKDGPHLHESYCAVRLHAAIASGILAADRKAREECAKVAETKRLMIGLGGGHYAERSVAAQHAKDIAKAIRATIGDGQ